MRTPHHHANTAALGFSPQPTWLSYARSEYPYICGPKCLVANHGACFTILRTGTLLPSVGQKAAVPSVSRRFDSSRKSCSSSVAVPVPIPLHELNLLRMMQVANERTVRELGPLPMSVLPVQKKRKPTASYTDFLRRIVPDGQPIVEEYDEMKLKQKAVLAALTMSGLAACSEGQPQREVTADSGASVTKTAAGIDKARAIETNNELTSPPSAQQSMVALRKKLTFRELSVIIGVDCKDQDKGLGCSAGDYEVGDYYDVELSPDCGQKGLFAGVTNKKGAVLVDRPPPKDTVSTATLSEGQLVCIQATAQIKGTPSWYYVTAVPAGNLPRCNGTQPCAKYGAREITWHVKHEDTACQSDGPKGFSGACAAGWSDAENFDVL